MGGEAMQRDPGTKQVVITVGSAIGYLGLGIAIWQLADDPLMRILLEAVYLLSIGLILTLRQYTKLSAERDQLRHSISQTENIAEELERARMLSDGMLSVLLVVSEKPAKDLQHHFSYIEEEYVISGDDGHYNWILQGNNVLSTPSTELVIKLAGDSPVDGDNLALDVTDELSGKAIDARLLEDHAFCKVFAIRFPVPLKRDEGFKLRVNCRWENTFARTRQHDYAFSAWGAYATQGIDRLVGRLVSDVPISEFLLERLEGELRRVKDPVQPKQIETRPHRNVLVWQIRDARHAFLLTFRKEL